MFGSFDANYSVCTNNLWKCFQFLLKVQVTCKEVEETAVLGLGRWLWVVLIHVDKKITAACQSPLLLLLCTSFWEKHITLNYTTLHLFIYYITLNYTTLHHITYQFTLHYITFYILQHLNFMNMERQHVMRLNICKFGEFVNFLLKRDKYYNNCPFSQQKLISLQQKCNKHCCENFL